MSYKHTTKPEEAEGKINLNVKEEKKEEETIRWKGHETTWRAKGGRNKKREEEEKKRKSKCKLRWKDEWENFCRWKGKKWCEWIKWKKEENFLLFFFYEKKKRSKARWGLRLCRLIRLCNSMKKSHLFTHGKKVVFSMTSVPLSNWFVTDVSIEEKKRKSNSNSSSSWTKEKEKFVQKNLTSYLERAWG